MAINKFRKRLALMVATISAASPMSTFATTTPATPTVVEVEHEDITSFDNTGDGNDYTDYDFQKLEDAILDAINLIEGTTASAIYGTDVKGEHSTSQVYYWATPEHKSTYDTNAKALLAAISEAQVALSQLSSNYANLDTTLNKDHNDADVTTPGLLHGAEVHEKLGTNTTTRFNMLAFEKNIAAVQDALNRGLVRTTGSATQYKDAVAAVNKAITSSQSLLATTSNPLTTKSGLDIPSLTTGTSIKLSYLDGDDITSGQSWVAVEHYTKLKEEVEKAKELLDNLYTSTMTTTEAATKTSQGALEAMADRLFGRDSTTPSNLAAVPTEGSLYEEFLSNAQTATDDGDIVQQRKQMEYLLIDALKHKTGVAVKTTADNIDIPDGETEDTDGDNTYYLTDPRDNSLIYKDGNTYLSTTTANTTTATVTYVTQDTAGYEGSDVIGSWVTTSAWATFEAAITNAITTYKDLDGNDSSADYDDANFITGVAIDYFDADYKNETTAETEVKIGTAFNTLKQALADFTEARNKGALGKIAEEKAEFLEVITEAQQTRGYRTATGYTTDTSVELATTHYESDADNVIHQSSKNGTDIEEAKTWVATSAWDTFETAITNAITTYNSIELASGATNELSLTEIKDAIIALEDATRDFDRVIEDEGLKEDYEEAMGDSTTNTDGLTSAITNATATNLVGNATIVDGELRADTNATVQPSIDGSDITDGKQWVETSEYTAFVEKIMEAEAMVADEATPNQLTKHELDDIVDMKKELAAAIDTFNGLIEEATSGELANDNTEFNALVEDAQTLWGSGTQSEYDGFDLLTTTTTITKIDGTTQGNYKTFEVKPDSTKIVSVEASDTFFYAIMDAMDYQNKDAEDKNLESTSEATTELQTAMDRFTAAQTPASGEKFTLFTSIYGENGDTGAVKLIRDTKTSEVNGADILTTDKWVRLSEKTAFTNVVNKSIGTLENETVKEVTVQQANTELNTATNNFRPTSGAGTLILFKNDLAKKINEAKYWVFDEAYIGSFNGDDDDDSVTPSASVTTRVYISDDLGRTFKKPDDTAYTARGEELWVSRAQHTSFERQINAAETALDNSNLSEQTLKTAKNNLQKQMDTFLDITQEAYTQAEFTSLETKFDTLIRTTKEALYGMDDGFVWGSNYDIKTSDLFGADIDRDEQWATKADVNTLNNALKVADGIYDRRENLTYDSIEDAFETFKTATETFTNEKYLYGLNDPDLEPSETTPGTHQAALWRDIVDARTTLATRNRSEVNGEDISTDSHWIDYKSYDAFKAAINTAEGTITKYTTDGTTFGAIDVVGKRFNQSIFNNAQKTLESAKEKFLAVTTQAGLGSLADKKEEYLEVINTVTGLIGVDKYEDASGNVTTTAFADANGTAALDKLTKFGYSLGEERHDGIEGIRKSNENNGVDVENKHLWLPSTQFDAITKTIDTSISDYQKPNLNVKLAQTKIDTLKQTNLKTWIESAKKSGRGTKQDVVAARTTLFNLIEEGYGLLAQTATEANTADEFIINISFTSSGTPSEYRMSELNGADVPSSSAWSSVAHNKVFNAALDKAVAAYQNKKADVKVLETAINALKKSLLTFEGGTDEEGKVYAPQWFASGGRDGISLSIRELNDAINTAKVNIAKLKVSALGSGADVSNEHILISSLKRTTSNLPILSEINAAFNNATSISKAKFGAYSKNAIDNAQETLTRLINEAGTTPGNKENTEAAKAALKTEIEAAQDLVKTKKPLATGFELFTIRTLEAKIREANTVLNNKYASVDGTSYTMKEDGKVEENTPGTTIEGKKYDIIGEYDTQGIRKELKDAAAKVRSIGLG